jgi:GNAT superfamily N-acetyltransferase
VEVREAAPEEEPTARGVLNAAMLAVDEATFERSLLLVAVEEGRVLGSLILDGEEVDVVAVRPGRRGQGVGTALVEAAAARRPTLTAAFDPSVEGFYESLGFDVDCEGADGRCRGVR